MASGFQNQMFFLVFFLSKEKLEVSVKIWALVYCSTCHLNELLIIFLQKVFENLPIDKRDTDHTQQNTLYTVCNDDIFNPCNLDLSNRT